MTEDIISTGDTAQVSWNLSAMLIEELAGYLKDSGRAYITGQWKDCITNLQLIQMRLYPYLDEEEVKKFNALHKWLDHNKEFMCSDSAIQHWKDEMYKTEEIKDYSPYKYDSRGYYELLDKQVRKVRSEFYYNIKEYNNLIMSALKKYGFLIKPAEDSKRMF